MALSEDIVDGPERGDHVGRGAMLVRLVREILLAVREGARDVRQRLVPDVLVFQLSELSEHLGRKLALAHEVQMFYGQINYHIIAHFGSRHNGINPSQSEVKSQ